MTWEVSVKRPLNWKKVRVKVRISTTGVYLFCIYEHDYSSRGVKLSWLSYLHMYGHEGHWDTKTAKPTLVLDSVLASLPVSGSSRTAKYWKFPRIPKVNQLYLLGAQGNLQSE